MKNLFAILLIGCSTSLLGQSLPPLDKSPLDYAYFPDNFAHDRKGDDKAIIRVTYSRPLRNDREIFGHLVKYGKVWRTGANECTEIRIYQDIQFGDQKLAAGTYSLFSIPEKDEWTIIFNSKLDYWGAYSYSETDDVLRVKAKVTNSKKSTEAFTIQFSESGDKGGVMKLVWDTVVAELPFTY